MVIKNNGRKIIGFGQTSVLPGQTVTIEDSFKDNETLKTFIALGFVEVIEAKSPDKGKTETPNPDASTDTPPADDNGSESK